MRTKFLVLVALAVCALGASAAAASAATISPGGSITGTDNGTVTLTSSGGSVITCTTASFGGTINTSGSGSLTSHAFSGCKFGFLNVTITASGTWGLSAAYNGGSPDGFLTVSSVSVHVSTFGCSFNATGSITGDLDNASSTVTFNSASGLTVSGVSGIFCPSGTAGAATLDGGYDISPSQTISA